MAIGAPDFVEPRVGWRVWNVVETDGVLRLASLMYRTVWLPGEEVVARCRRPLAALPWERMPLHGPPSNDCLCGIYAVAQPARALPYLSCRLASDRNTLLRVVGLVSLWGRVVEADWGWRATYAYPAFVLVPATGRRRRAPRRLRGSPSPAATAEALGEYAVPVEVIESPAGSWPSAVASSVRNL